MSSIDTSPTPANAVTALAGPLAASLGLYIWGVEIAFGPRSLVRVYVESEAEGGVDIDSCAKLSRLLGLSLEVEDIFPGAYVLEISSPGLERVFFTPAQLVAYTGQVVSITLKNPAEDFFGRKKFQGVLVAAATDDADATASAEADAAESVHANAAKATEEQAAELDEQSVFILRVDDSLLQEEGRDILRFTFADLKKARLVHRVPEKTLPGKKKKKSTME